LLKKKVEQLIVEAKRLGLELDEVQDAAAKHWDRLTSREPEPAAKGELKRR
jgi:hypothetical protein